MLISFGYPIWKSCVQNEFLRTYTSTGIDTHTHRATRKWERERESRQKEQKGIHSFCTKYVCTLCELSLLEMLLLPKTTAIIDICVSVFFYFFSAALLICVSLMLTMRTISTGWCCCCFGSVLLSNTYHLPSSHSITSPRPSFAETYLSRRQRHSKYYIRLNLRTRHILYREKWANTDFEANILESCNSQVYLVEKILFV